MKTTTMTNHSSFFNTVSALCKKHSLNEQEFTNLLKALVYVEEKRKKEAIIICAEFVSKRITENQE